MAAPSKVATERHPRILTLIRYGMTARNLLRTEFLTELQRAGVELIVAAPASQEPYFQDEMAQAGILLVDEPSIRKPMIERIYQTAANLLSFEHPGTSKTLTMKWWHEGLVDRRFSAFILQGLASLPNLHRSKRIRRGLLKLDRRFLRHPEIGQLFDEFKPDLFVSNYTFEPDAHYLAEAHRRGIPTIGIVKSWDNLTSKTRIAVEPNHLVVWSPQMKHEAIRYHYFPEERIEVTGTPQFDFHFSPEKYPTREEFFGRLGIDPAKKLVVFSPGTNWTTSDYRNVQLIHEIISDPSFPFDCHIHIRKYPKRQLDYSIYERNFGATIESAGPVVQSWADEFDQSAEDMEQLRRIMHFADVVVQVASTIAVDAACHNTPCIAMSFDRNDSTAPWGHRSRRAYGAEHNQILLRCGGMTLVETKAALREWLIRYLEHPETREEGRAKVVEEILWKGDGSSARRLAHAVLAKLPAKSHTGV